MVQKLQEELRARDEEAHEAEENIKRLVNEKAVLEQRISRLERKITDEVTSPIVNRSLTILILFPWKMS